MRILIAEAGASHKSITDEECDCVQFASDGCTNLTETSLVDVVTWGEIQRAQLSNHKDCQG